MSRRTVRIALAAVLVAVSLGPPARGDIEDLGNQAAGLLPPGAPLNSAVGRAGVFESYLQKNAGVGNLVYTSVGYVPAIFQLGIKNTTPPHRLGSRVALAASLATIVPSRPAHRARQGYPDGSVGVGDDDPVNDVPEALRPGTIGLTNARWIVRRTISSRSNYFDPTDPDGQGPADGLLVQDDTNPRVIERGKCDPVRNPPPCPAHVRFTTPVFTKADKKEPGLPGMMGRSWFVLYGTPEVGPPFAGVPPPPGGFNWESLAVDDLNDHVTLEFEGLDADGDGKNDELWVRQDERIWAGNWISDRRVSEQFASGALANLIHASSTQNRGEIYNLGLRQRIVGGTGLFTGAAGETLSVASIREVDGFSTGKLPQWNYYETFVYARIPCTNPGVVPANCYGPAKDSAYDYTTPPGPDQVACNDGVDNDGDGAADYPADRECFTPWDQTEDR